MNTGFGKNLLLELLLILGSLYSFQITYKHMTKVSLQNFYGRTFQFLCFKKGILMEVGQRCLIGLCICRKF